MRFFHRKKSDAACPECASVPANHTLTWIAATLDVALSGAGPKHASSVSSSFARMAGKIMAFLWPLFSSLARGLRILSYNNEIERALTTRSRMIWEVAWQRGIAVRQLVVFGMPTELFEVQLHGSSYVFQSLPVPPQYQIPAWADDKYLLKRQLLQDGIAAPAVYSISTLAKAEEVLDRLGAVCVKPRNGSNGRHTFPYVKTREELEQAFYSAKKLCHWVVIEEHLEGNLVRATCVGGKLVGFLECEYPTVRGDGRSTIRALIERQNNQKSLYARDIEITSVHERYIARRGYHMDSVLEPGKILPLIYWAGFGSGGKNKEYGSEINPGLKKELERAARITGLAVVGFDVIMQDPNKGPDEQKWGIIEANSLPWIDLHFPPKYGKSINVAASIWDLWEKPVLQKALAEAKAF